MKRLLIVLVLLFAGSAVAADMPYNPSANVKAEVHAALVKARASHKPVLLIFGANWCADCRALGKDLASGKNAALIASHFEVVKVWVGNFNKNLDVVNAYGNPIAKGIPAAVVVSPGDKVLYSTKAGELANARTMSKQGIYGFFENAVAKAKAQQDNPSNG